MWLGKASLEFYQLWFKWWEKVTLWEIRKIGISIKTKSLYEITLAHLKVRRKADMPGLLWTWIEKCPYGGEHDWLQKIFGLFFFKVKTESVTVTLQSPRELPDEI